MADILGTSGNDILNGTGDADIIQGLGGNDTIDGGDGNDTIYGGLGTDILNGGNGDDTFIEDQPTSSTETFNGGAGFDTVELRAIPSPIVTLFGLLSPHTLSGASSLTSIERLVFASQPGQVVQASLLYSGWAAAGITQIVGGAGRDYVSIVTGPTAGTYTMPSLPLSGWDGLATNAWEWTGDFVILSGGQGQAGTSLTLNALAGASFVQFIAGGASDDAINGSDNADLIDATRGVDQVNAGGGNDSIAIINVAVANGSAWLPPTTFTGAGSTFNGGAGTDVLTIGGSVDLQATLVGIEGVFLAPGVFPPTPITSRQDEAYLVLDQTHLAMLPATAFFAGTGNVEIVLDPGGSFNGSQYTFSPGANVDFLIYAGDGNGVSITGTSGDDRIFFGIGTQTATGGAGGDNYSLNAGVLTVTDFSLAEDEIDFSDTGLSSMSRINDFLVQQAGGAAFVADSGGDHYELRLNGVSAASLTADQFVLDTLVYNNVETGTALADILFGLSLDDQLNGGNGNDRIYSGGGVDRLFGEGGDDVLILDGAVTGNSGTFGSPVFDGGTGQDTLLLRSYATGGPSVFSLFFSGAGPNGFVGIETMQFDSKLGEVVTGALVLEQIAASGLTSVIGGAGSDTFVAIAVNGTAATMPNLTLTNWSNVAGGDTMVLAVANTNTTGMTLSALEGLASNQALVGAGGNDTLNGASGDDRLLGNAGNDVLNGGAGADALDGGVGNDSYVVDNAGDTIVEAIDAGQDTVTTRFDTYLGIYANIENLTLAAGAGALFGVGTAGVNTLTGNESGNLLIGGDGDDTVNGGAGNDSLFGEQGGDALYGDAGIDYLAAGIGNDFLYGGDDPDNLYGEDGDDTLDGGNSFHTDILVGGAGNDTLDGSSGQANPDYDLMDGGSGDDIYYVDTGDDLTFEAIGGGTDTVHANVTVPNAGVYLYANVENLVLEGTTAFGVGNELANQLTGSASGNWLLGGLGNDTISGLGGNDVLFGEGGADTFVFGASSGADVIGDFVHGTDKIQLNGIYADFASLQSHFVQGGNDGAIDLGGGNLIVLHGVDMATLTATDFIFG
jgi:Ca2+-binding RTX toxin-like protein